MLEDTEVASLVMDDPPIFKDVSVYLGSDQFTSFATPESVKGVLVQDFKFKVIPDA